MSPSSLGALLALISALFFGLNNATARRGVVTGSVHQALCVTVPVNAAAFLACTLFTGQLGRWHSLGPTAIGALALAGVINYVVARYCNYRGVKIIGAVKAGPIMQVGLIVAVAGGVLFLSERMTALRAVSIVLILVGSTFTLPARGAGARGAGDLTDPAERFEGYVYSLLGSLAYGVAPVLIRAGAGGTGLGLLGGLIAFLAALAVLVVITIAVPGQLAHLFELDRKSAAWFIVTGLLNGVAQVTLFMALAIAPVTIVIPIQRLSVVFRVLFSYVINREIESFHPRILLGVLISLIGAITVSL